MDPLLQTEQKFLSNLHKISNLDKILTEISDNFNQGLTDIAYLRFKNETLGYSLTGLSYSETPAKRVLNQSEKGGYKLAINKENTWFLDENSEEDELLENKEELGLEEDFNEKTGLLAENELKEIRLEEQILMKFGISNRDPLIYHAQDSFLRSLERLIELKNIMDNIGVYEKK